MILVWFERSRGDEFDSGNNCQVETNFCKKSRTGFEITKKIVHEFVHEKNRARFHDSCTIKFFRARFFSCTIF